MYINLLFWARFVTSYTNVFKVKQNKNKTSRMVAKQWGGGDGI